MEIIGVDIFIEILNWLPIKELLKMQLINKKIKLLVRKNKWPNVIIRTNNINFIRFLAGNFSFAKYDFGYCGELTDASVKELRNCHTLNLSCCNQITDAGVKE